jgi:MraZ protein
VAETGDQGRCFFGRHEFAVDGQRRLSIPSPWRREEPVATRFILLPDSNGSIQAIPADDLEETFAHLRRRALWDEEAQAALQAIGEYGQNAVCDRHGRICVEPALLEHAGISDRAVLVGAMVTFHIWSPERCLKRKPDLSHSMRVMKAIHAEPDDLTKALRNALREQ